MEAIAGELAHLEISKIKLNPAWPYRKDLGKLLDLCTSMKGPNGLIQAIGVDTSGFLVWGRRRLEAAKELGWTEILSRIVDVANPLQAMKEENENRAPLSPSDQTAIMRVIEAKKRQEAKDRQREHAGTAPNTPGNISGSDKGESRDKAAAAFGHSGKTFEKMKKIDEKATPAVKEKWDEGKVSTSDAAKIVDEPPKVQDAAVKAVEEGKASTLAEAVKPKAKPKKFDWAPLEAELTRADEALDNNDLTVVRMAISAARRFIDKHKSATPAKPKPSNGFVPPSVEEVRAYCTERKNSVDAEAFVDFYQSKGWLVGKVKMKDWRASVRTWEKNAGSNHGARKGTRSTEDSGHRPRGAGAQGASAGQRFRG